MPKTPPPADYPANVEPAELERLARKLGVNALPADTFRARVCEAHRLDADATLDREVTPLTGTPAAVVGSRS